MAVDRISPNARGCVLGWVRLWTSYAFPSVSPEVAHDLPLDVCESAQLQRGTSLLCCVSSPKVCGCDVADVQHVPCQSEVPSPTTMSGVVSFTESGLAGSIGIPPGVLIPRRLLGRKRNASAATKARTTVVLFKTGVLVKRGTCCLGPCSSLTRLPGGPKGKGEGWADGREGKKAMRVSWFPRDRA